MIDSIFKSIINSNQENWLGQIINPLMPYFICNHHISTEINQSDQKFVGLNFEIQSNDILKNNNLSAIKNYDIIQLQVDYFEQFCKYILPYLKLNKIKIILITSQWHIPQIELSTESYDCLNHESILLWVSQNPIYSNHKKYMALPYGINQHSVSQYVEFLKNYEEVIKNDSIFNGHALAHAHLPSNHIRNVYKIFGENSPPRLDYYSYLTMLSKSKFAFSTTGDRDDCYRHYECIGLKTIPISNVRDDYKEIFESNMIYLKEAEMAKLIKIGNFIYPYSAPNRDMLTTIYWKMKIFSKIRELIGD